MTRMQWCVFAAAALTLSAVAGAETVWVKSESADIREGQGSIYRVLTSAVKGQPLEILAHNGHWLQVKISPTTNGWVYDSAISPTQIAGNNGLFNMQAGPIGQVNTGAGSKGFDESTEVYAANKNYSKAPLQHLVDLKHSIPPAEWEKFIQAVQTGKE